MHRPVRGSHSSQLVVTLVTLLAAHGAFIAWVGARLAPDSWTYRAWADRLIATGFDYSTFLHSGADPDALGRSFYLGYVTLVAVFRMALGDDWLVGIVAVNVIALALTGTIVVYLASRLTGSRVGGWIALGFFLFAFDLASWARFALSDVPAALANTALLAVLVELWFEHPPKRLRRLRMVAAVLLLFALVARPTGVLLVPTVIAAVTLATRPDDLARRMRLLLLLGVAALLVAMVAQAYFLQDPARYPFQTLRGAIERAAQRTATGEVVSVRRETFHAPPRTLLDFVGIFLDRSLRFFQFMAPGFSRIHNALAAAYYVPLYACGIAAVAGLRRMTHPGQAAVFLAATYVLTAALFHGVTYLDFDWRYRAPTLPTLAVLASVGATMLGRRVRSAGAGRLSRAASGNTLKIGVTTD